MAEKVDTVDNDELVVRARSQSEALSRLYELYYERIFRFCVHRLFDRESAEDVTSSVFLAVAGGIRAFDGRTEKDFRNWIYAIATNQTNAHIRKVSRRKRLLSTAAETVAMKDHYDAPGQTASEWPRVYRAISRLKAEHQTIVTLRFFENLGYDDIGRITGSRPETVRVSLHRALKKLRKYLGDRR